MQRQRNDSDRGRLVAFPGKPKNDKPPEEAAERLLALTKAGLGGGLAAFTEDGRLVAAYRGIFKVGDTDGDFEARIPHPDGYADDDELGQACEWEIQEGLALRRANESDVLWSALIERGTDEIRSEALELPRDEEARRAWLRRLA
jgi:hypothetical protein